MLYTVRYVYRVEGWRYCHKSLVLSETGLPPIIC